MGRVKFLLPILFAISRGKRKKLMKTGTRKIIFPKVRIVGMGLHRGMMAHSQRLKVD